MRKHIRVSSSDSFSPSAPDSDSRRVEREGAPTAAIIGIDRSFIVSSRTDASRHRVAAALFTTATARRLTRGPKGRQRRELKFGYGCRVEVRARLKFKIRNHSTARIATLLAYRPLCQPPSNTGVSGVFGEDCLSSRTFNMFFHTSRASSTAARLVE